MIMSRDKVIRLVRRKKFSSFQFLSADTRTILGRNVMKNDPRHSGLSANRRTSIEPDGFLLPRAVIRNCRHDQIFEHSCRTIGDDVPVGSEINEPFVDRGPIMRGESASIVMIAGANCDRNKFRKFPDKPRNFTRLL